MGAFESLHAGVRVPDRGSDGFLGSWRARNMPELSPYELQPVRGHGARRGHCRATSYESSGDGRLATSSRAKQCPASFHLVDQRPVYLDTE